MSLFILFILTIIFLYSVRDWAFVEAQKNTRYQNCSRAFHCGNTITDIGYPFWGSNRANYCGHPKFQLICTDEFVNIEIQGLNYRVLHINAKSMTLTVAREDYIGEICPGRLANTTLDREVMSYGSGTQIVTLYYGCPNSKNESNSFSCNDGAGLIVTLEMRNANYTEPCTAKVLVSASQSAVEAMEKVTQNDLLVALKQGFVVEWNADNSLCEMCEFSGGVCGYNSSTYRFTCHCSDGGGGQNWYSCTAGETDNRKSGSTITTMITIGITLSAVTASVALFGIYWFMRKRGILRGAAAKQDDNVEAFISNYRSLVPQRYSYSTIKRMTNSFGDKLGQGGFGSVYRGKLSDGRVVAVKLLQESTGNGEEFINEVASISRTSHVNIVTLLGFCYENTRRALVYEYMPNGSLDKFICRDHEGTKLCQLEQKTLFEIAISIARGLEYLHRGCNTRIVHFDIKPHNILLDQDFCPKIADFGLAKLCKGKGSTMSMLGARGTAGYVAPEVFMRGYGGVSYKSDVYSYGMMMLEMFAGKQTGETQTSSDAYFPDFIYKNLERGHICAHDENMADEEEEMVRRMIIVGLWCIQPDPTNRPSMTKVIEMLEGSTELLQVPPKPLLFSSVKPTKTFSALSSSMCTLSVSERDEDKILSSPEAEISIN